MPGFLGGSSGGSSGTGGEISFPKEFIDPVTKLRVSQPENLIDTDFEYGLQPTKWETVELINNTPSFFSKSGDTTIPNITSITTNAGTREITVTCALEHGVSVGIPIQVTGTKSITADGSYIINSIPNTTTFTYLCKANQPTTASIEDLYSSIITGEFFQGSQLRVADASGIVTDNEEGTSTLTVSTDSAHGFKVNTPFYFLNLNSTISKDFQASNTAAKSFDSTNSAVAQTFDGSNTLSSINIDWSNSATVGGVVSSISGVSTTNNTITVAHSTENFQNQPLGTPLYYAVTGGSGYFATNPRGVIFLKSTTSLGTSTSTFQVSEVPDGDVIPITAALSGTFQLANQARTFAGNNTNPLTQINLDVIKDTPIVFDGGNQGYAGAETNGLCTVEGYSGTILVSTTSGAGLDYYVGAMVKYTTTGSAASGLVNNRTYFIASYAANATANFYNITLKEYPDSASALAPTGGSGTQTFTKIGISTDKDIVHVKNSDYASKDMLEYSFPEGGRFTAATSPETKLFYFVSKKYDTHNYELSEVASSFTVATGGIESEVSAKGATYKVHTFLTPGTSTFTVTSVGSVVPTVEYLIVGGGGGGATDADVGGGGGAGGLLTGSVSVTAQSYSVVVGAGGARGTGPDNTGTGGGSAGGNGGNSSFAGLTAIGGGGGGTRGQNGAAGGSGGGGGDASNLGGAGTTGQGFAGGNAPGMNSNSGRDSGAGGGAGGAASGNLAGPGLFNSIGGAVFAKGGIGSQAGMGGTAGANNTGNGGDGTRAGGSGIVVIRYPITTPAAFVAPTASGGVTTTTVDRGITYRIHSFTSVGSNNFVVSSTGSWNEPMEYLIVAGGGAGEQDVAAGGGAGGVLSGTFTATARTYSVTVGNGATTSGANGENSAIATIATAIGGGGAGNWSGNPGKAGGSGGGGAGQQGGSGGAGGAGTVGPPRQGWQGAQGTPSTSYGGGGGGAGGPAYAQDGGLGITSSITGTTRTYAGGGGGGSDNRAGAGGSGIGGNGSLRGQSPTSGATNTGSGGGGHGCCGAGGNGGSGIVIIRYPIAFS